MTSSTLDESRALLAAGDEQRRAGAFDDAIATYEKAAALFEVAPGDVCVRIARAHVDRGDTDAARVWALRTADAGDDFASWDAAAQLLASIGLAGGAVKRRARIAVLGSYTTTYLARLLRFVAATRGIDVESYESDYDQFRQELFDPASGVHGFRPDIVVLALDARAAMLPDWSDTPTAEVANAFDQLHALWDRASSLGATVVQHTFVVPPEAALANLDATLPGSRHHMLGALNARIAAELPAHVRLVDCERLAGVVGKQQWCDPLWWDRAKLAVSLPFTPLLARHTVAVIAGVLGVARKCLVVDLDNTLWGGVVGEEGVAGLKIGGDATGDAFVAFQERLRSLRRRGVILAACSKNDEHVAREPFEQHPEMRLRLDDFAAFVANWQSKVDNIKQIAADLSIGLDAIAYADDNPVERQEVRRFLPEVDVIALPPQPSLFARALADYAWFETGSFTTEDAQRAEQYRARAEISRLERSATSIDDFYRDLEMHATIRPFDDADLPRVAQLIGKTNQFNLTGRRHALDALQRIATDPKWVHRTLRLRDRFTDHGLVGVVIGRVDGDTLDIDTWLMSCRVIGRRAEHAMLGALARAAADAGCSSLRGTFVPSGRNDLVRDLYPSLGFALERDDDGTTVWRGAIDDDTRAGTPFIDVEA